MNEGTLTEEVTPAETPQPRANPSLASLMLTCPKSWQGDAGLLEWCTNLNNQGLSSVPPTTLSAISPKHVKANTTPTVTLTGTGFDPATVKVQIIATQLTPNPTPTATSLSVVISAALIATSGSLVQVSVVNGTGAISNALNLYID